MPQNNPRQEVTKLLGNLIRLSIAAPTACYGLYSTFYHLAILGPEKTGDTILANPMYLISEAAKVVIPFLLYRTLKHTDYLKSNIDRCLEKIEESRHTPRP